MTFDIGNVCNVGLSILWYNVIKNDCFLGGQDCKENVELELYLI